MQDPWQDGKAYESYMGRWSQRLARQLLHWISVPDGSRWLDVGCGTGVVAQTILDYAVPAQIIGLDHSPGYIAFAREQRRDGQVQFVVTDAQALPLRSAVWDAAVSALALNFLPNPARGVSEMRRAIRPGGIVAACVWDYGGEMQFLRFFWDAACELDPRACELDEGRRFPLCQPGALSALFSSRGLREVEGTMLVVPTDFENFEDFWAPFLSGQGPAPGYLAALDEHHRKALRERLRSTLPVSTEGRISLTARAWAVRGKV